MRDFFGRVQNRVAKAWTGEIFMNPPYVLHKARI